MTVLVGNAFCFAVLLDVSKRHFFAILAVNSGIELVHTDIILFDLLQLLKPWMPRARRQLTRLFILEMLLISLHARTLEKEARIGSHMKIGIGVSLGVLLLYRFKCSPVCKALPD